MPRSVWDTRGQDVSHFRGQTFSISIDFATKVADKATHPNIPRTPEDTRGLASLTTNLSRTVWRLSLWHR